MTGRVLAAWLATAMLGGCATATPATLHGRPSPARVIAWVDRPAPPPSPPPSPAPPEPRYSQCAATHLRATPGPGGAAAGNLAIDIRFINIGARPCTLSGYPRGLVGIRAGGARVTLHPQHGTMFDDAHAWPVDLRPGQAGSMSIATADSCAALNSHTPRHDRYAGEVLTLPDGSDIEARAPFDAACGVGVTKIGRRGEPAPDPDGYPGLMVTSDRPGSAPHATTLHFTVTLSNAGSTTLRLDRCPIYTMGGYGPAGSYGGSYELNCDTVHSIAPGAAITYAMQLRLPDRPCLAKFGWSIPAARSATVAGTVQVT